MFVHTKFMRTHMNERMELCIHVHVCMNASTCAHMDACVRVHTYAHVCVQCIDT